MTQGLGQGLAARFGAGFAPYQGSGGISPLEAAAQARMASGQKKKGQGQALGGLIGSFYGNPQAGAAIGGMAGGLAGGDDLSDIDFSSLAGLFGGGGDEAAQEATMSQHGMSTHPAQGVTTTPTPGAAPGDMSVGAASSTPGTSEGFRALMTRSTPEYEEDEILTLGLMNPQFLTATGGVGY